jgi:hypothetical protein
VTAERTAISTRLREISGMVLSSSDYSRSGCALDLCPNLLLFPWRRLQPGRHSFSVTVPMGKPEGSSFSHWNISGVRWENFEKILP